MSSHQNLRRRGQGRSATVAASEKARDREEAREAARERLVEAYYRVGDERLASGWAATELECAGLDQPDFDPLREAAWHMRRNEMSCIDEHDRLTARLRDSRGELPPPLPHWNKNPKRLDEICAQIFREQPDLLRPVPGYQLGCERNDSGRWTVVVISPLEDLPF